MKKFISLLMVVLCFITVVACDKTVSNKESSGVKPAAGTEKLSVVCTIFPQYDWVKQIIGDNKNVELTLLLDNGVDLHNYQPTADDIIKISNCDLFIYVGGESDKWVDNALKDVVNKNMIVINLLDVLKKNLKEEEVVEGMQSEEDDEENTGEEVVEYDEHVWLSLRNASVICDTITDALSQLDAHNANTYTVNNEVYTSKLSILDKDYQNTVSSAAKDTLLFGDRFPFRYLADDYGLNYYAAFVGCSAETEASFETVVFLSKKVDELNLPVVLSIDKSNQKISQAIINNTTKHNQKILVMDSIQSVTSQDVAAGKTYLSIMRSNLSILHDALN